MIATDLTYVGHGGAISSLKAQLDVMNVSGQPFPLGPDLRPSAQGREARSRPKGRAGGPVLGAAMPGGWKTRIDRNVAGRERGEPEPPWLRARSNPVTLPSE